MEVSGTRPSGDDDPYKLTRADGPHWLDGFFANLATTVAESWPSAEPEGEPLIASKLVSYIEVPNELLMDYGVIPDTRPKPPPPSWRTRLRGKIEDRIDTWRNLAARRAYKVIAGDWPGNGEDDW